jgi:hypothetical protein
MKRVRLDSTSIASIGFAPRKRQMEIEFRESGAVYLYLGVPPEEHAAFMAAESKGEYLNQVFKPRGYRYIVKKKGR